MKALGVKQQAGYVLLLMVLALMGIGGAVIAGFTQGAKQEVDQQRFLHNQRVLEEAKQALLMYAYRYPETAASALPPNVRGPGRLPCPDTDNNGNPDPLADCIDAGVAMVGRFPWAANGMDFYDIRDASGQRLWYAVSQNFNNFDAAEVINSDKPGTITIHDQTGELLYDGSADGIAAVIIAPGPAIDRNGVVQDRSVGAEDPFDTIADTEPGIIDPVNYLDISGARDNADFTNDSAVDGFILGPIDDLAADDLVVNDQIILITVEEVIAVAEKAVLAAYRDAIEDYQRNIWGLVVADYRYPWLDSYNDPSPLSEFDADITAAAPAPVIGRVPSIFANYFATNDDDSQPIESEMRFFVNVDGHPVEAQAAASVAPDIFFKANGNLSSSFNSGVSFSGWVWDGHPVNVPTLPNDGIWESCPYVTGTEEDCNQDVLGNFIGMGGIIPGQSDVWLQVRQVTFTFNGASPFEFPFSSMTDPGVTPLVYTPPDVANHATVTAEYTDAGNGIISSVIWSQDNDFKNSFTEEPVGNNGVLTFDGADTITVGLRYYPELPRWAWRNGWHDMVQAAYSSALQPGGDGICTAGVDDCLTLQGIPGVNNDKIALLVLSGNEGDDDPPNTALIDVAGIAPFYVDDLGIIFEGENNDLDLVFDQRSPNANDVVLLLE